MCTQARKLVIELVLAVGSSEQILKSQFVLSSSSMHVAIQTFYYFEEACGAGNTVVQVLIPSNRSVTEVGNVCDGSFPVTFVCQCQ